MMLSVATYVLLISLLITGYLPALLCVLAIGSLTYYVVTR